MIIKSILKINPNAECLVRGSDINTCEIEWLNGTTPIPKADIEAKMAELPAIEEQEATQIETDKSSGKQKLKDLGLTDAEIKALTGA
jgi:phosphoribosylaminoimidazole carboxylase (NCAIR synthetase)